MYVLKLLAIFLTGIVLTAIVYGIILLLRMAIQSLPRRPKEPGFQFIYVNDEGGARELFQSEKEYMLINSNPAEGGRQYIKAYYEELTPDGHMRGYLRRRQLPKRIAIDS